MCNLHHVTPKDDLETYLGKLGRAVLLPDYGMTTVGPFQPGLFIRPRGGALIGQIGQWGMIRPGQPERIDYIQPKVSPGSKPRAPRPRSTNNARIEDIERKPTFKEAWLTRRRCLVPAAWYQEPNWETGRNIWWRLARADGNPWMIAGLWSEWIDPRTGEIVPNFTVITCNCDGHPLLGRLHKPEPDLPPDAQDKRSLVHVEPENWDAWLHGDPRTARELLRPSPAEVFDQDDVRRTDQLLIARRASGS